MINYLKKYWDAWVKAMVHKSKCIIVDFDVHTSMVTFTCRGGRVVFKRSLMEVSLDPTLIAELDVLQACYLGLKVAEFLQYKNEPMSSRQEIKASLCRPRAGVTGQVTFDRYGYVIYLDPESETMASHPVMSIVKSEFLLRKFPPDIAYALGIHAGKRLYSKSMAVAFGGNVVDFRGKPS